MSHLVECSPSLPEALGSYSALHEPGMMADASNPSTREVEERRSEVQGHPQLLSEWLAWAIRELKKKKSTYWILIKKIPSFFVFMLTVAQDMYVLCVAHITGMKLEQVMYVGFRAWEIASQPPALPSWR